jgi:hypothetical protein
MRWIVPKLKGHYRALRKAGRQLIGYPVIRNANGTHVTHDARRALLIYTVQPFRLSDGDRRFLNHQNLRQCKQIASVLGEFGYIVDVADVEDERFRPSEKYDLIISHRVDLESVFWSHMAGALRIYLFTGMNHIVHNQNVAKRYRDLRARRGCTLQPYRVHGEHMPYVVGAHALVGFGNEVTMDTWREAFGGPIYSFNNYGFRSVRFAGDGKDFATARRSFLFFGSQDQVGKGLDLLLEVFPRHPDLNLYVCGMYEQEQDFCQCYYRELYATPNVHPRGWVRVNGPMFEELTRNCAYVILPTCSEGSAGSVIQCMYAGLIPIVTREAGIDTADFGVMLASERLAELEKTILELAELPPNWHRERSYRTRRVAEQEFSESCFVHTWRRIIHHILEAHSVEDDR